MPPTPNAERTFAMVCLTQSFSVSARSRWASLHRVTMLAVPSPFSSSSRVVSSEKLKNWSPSVRMPPRSHSRRWNSETGKLRAKSSCRFQGRVKFSYRSRDSRFGGSSYGDRISRSSSKRAVWTASALTVDGSGFDCQLASGSDGIYLRCIYDNIMMSKSTRPRFLQTSLPGKLPPRT